MIRSSFASFTTARLAIQANQSALAIVGQNMANAKTPGYTRQRIDQISLNSQGISSKYLAVPEARIGYGVMVTGVSQIRDPYLDTRYRIEMGHLGTMDKRVEILDKIGMVIDDTSSAAMKNHLADLSTQLSDFASGKATNDNLVSSSMQSITAQFRELANRLDGVKKDVEDTANSDVKAINELLKGIQELNVNIHNSQVHGSPALELQDERNLMIDELATYINISVTHSTDVTMTGSEVDVLKIDMIGEGNSGRINLINDVNTPGSFSLKQDTLNNGEYRLQVKDSLGATHNNVSSAEGTLKSTLGMINDMGEFGEPPTTNRGVGYYQSALDNMAQVFADTFNSLNTVVDKDDPTKILGGPLLAANDGSDKITAANITISDEWMSGEVEILRSRDPSEPSGSNTNIDNMINALTKDKQSFTTEDGTTIFSGNFYDCYVHIINVQATDQKASTASLDTYLGVTKEIAKSKDSVSGVNIDEEGMNLLQYNNSLTAASRLMTTLDECLSTIISSMGVVGR